VPPKKAANPANLQVLAHGALNAILGTMAVSYLGPFFHAFYEARLPLLKPDRGDRGAELV
jgi:hypothetical protein